jgi:GAF domain-containing protein
MFPSTHINIPEETLQEWQEVADTLAELVDVPAALIMRLSEPDIEVLVSSRTDGNPYEAGEGDLVEDSGLYCETVIRQDERLLVPNAPADPHWADNPDVPRGMISYLGFPVHLPDGSPFGTICVLDSKPNAYSDAYTRLMGKLRDLIESRLALLYMNQQLGDQNAELREYIGEIKTLRGILHICAFCKKVRTESGEWVPVDQYITEHSDAAFSHAFCPECTRKHYGIDFVAE